jgi:hypothetical protein
MKRTCFIICPLGNPNSDTRKNANLLCSTIIDPALKGFSFSIKRADKSNVSGSITEQIISDIKKSELCIIDLTELNPNVMYEFGRRAETGKPFIVMAQYGQELPFDTSDINTIFYKLDFAEDAKTEIRGRIKEMNKHNLLEPSNTSNNGCLVLMNGLPDRRMIVAKFRPELYFPLEAHLFDIAGSPACHVEVFPYVFLDDKKTSSVIFTRGRGFRFNGRNMISVHLTDNSFPSAEEPRSFAFAIRPTSNPTPRRPMFFFSYGQRISHKSGDGINNHDKCFGVYWGEPDTDEPIPDKFKGMGLRGFFYCEHSKEDRTSENCDTEVILEPILNKWQFIVVTYDSELFTFYMNGEKVKQLKVNIDTSEVPYLNIGGFVYHHKDGALIAQDIDYSMNGYIREFMMFRESLAEGQVKNLFQSVKAIFPKSAFTALPGAKVSKPCA